MKRYLIVFVGIFFTALAFTLLSMYMGQNLLGDSPVLMCLIYFVAISTAFIYEIKRYQVETWFGKKVKGLKPTIVLFLALDAFHALLYTACFALVTWKHDFPVIYFLSMFVAFVWMRSHSNKRILKQQEKLIQSVAEKHVLSKETVKFLVKQYSLGEVMVASDLAVKNDLPLAHALSVVVNIDRAKRAMLN